MDVAAAQRFLDDAQREPDRFRRHLLLAAAISALSNPSPIVVGGTAEQYWARDEYRETDLDMCGGLAPAVIRQLREMGFTRQGRYWEFEGEHNLAAEFPETQLAGDEARVVEVPVRGQKVRFIGVDDLYLDRLRQATSRPQGDEDRLAGAYAILATRIGEMDFRYIERQIEQDIAVNPFLELMAYMHRHLTRGIRRERTFPEVLRLLRTGPRRRVP